MNYERIYDSIIERAPKERPLDIYTEEHHIIPKCMGGTDADGLAYLLPEEHYVAHQLLVKMYPNHLGILCAASLMCTDAHGKRVNNKLYGWLKKRKSASMKGQKRSAEICKNISDGQRGKKLSSETRRKISEAKKGKKLTEEHRQKISEGVRHHLAPSKIERSCEYCGTICEVSNMQFDKNRKRFCNLQCSNAAKRTRITKFCNHCNVEFTIIPSAIKKGGGKFCCRQCWLNSKRSLISDSLLSHIK